MQQDIMHGRHTLLLAHILRCKEVFQAAHANLKPDAFSGDFHYPHRMVWRAALDLYAKYRQMPNEAMLLAETIRLMDTSPSTNQYMVAQEKQLAIYLIQKIFSAPADNLVVTYAQGVLQELIYDSQLKPMAQQIQHAPDLNTFNQTIAQLNVAYKAAQISAPEAVDIFSDEYLSGMEETRIPTGAMYFDMLLGGGINEGEVYGLLGGAGGGKTLTAIEVGCSLAMKGYKVNYFTYEQPVTGDLTRRLYASAGGININELKRPKDQWPQPVKDSMTELHGVFRQNFHIYDMSGRTAGMSGIDEVEGILRHDQNRGQHAVLNIYDWLLVAIRRYMSTKNMNENAVRSEVQRWVDCCVRYGDEYGGASLIVNQLAPAQLGNPGKLPRWTEAAEAKSFAWLLNACFVLGVATPSNFLQIGVDKNRGGKRTHCSVKMDPFHQRMIPQDHMVYDASTGDFRDERQNATYVPKDNGKPASDAEELAVMP